MALFSRRPKGVPDDASPAQAPDAGASVEDQNTAVEEDVTIEPAVDPDESAAAASVDISVSSFRGLGATGAPPAPPATPPRKRAASVASRQTETVPGLRDNVLVRDALAELPAEPTPLDLLNVARQLMQGHLFLRVKGDARALLAEGKQLPLAVATVGDRSFTLAYSSGAALQASVRADGDVDTSAMGQPVLSVLRHVLAGSSEGLIVDSSSAPARAIFPRALLEKLLEALDESLTLKTLLAEERTADTPAAVAAALTTVPFWVAVGRGEGDRLGIAEGRGDDGSRFLELYSHPLEVAAMGRDDRPAPLTGAQLAGALRADEGLTGVIVDPGGPWITLTRGDLAPLLTAAD